jgi:hypothetical protein
MAAPLSSVLRSINRDDNRPLNILYANNHEGYSATLAKTGHNFYVLQHPRFHPWDTKERPLPPNFFMLNGKDIPDQLKIDISFDLVLTQNRIDHYPIMLQLAQQLNCPLLQMEHTLPWPDWDDKTTDQVGHLKCDHNIFVADFSVGAWFHDLDDPDVSVLRHGMDTEYWNGWVGGDGKVMSAVWDYIKRDRICGFSLWKEVTEGLPVSIWGETPGLSKMADNTDHLRDLYRRASVYLNTTLWSSCPFSLLEAMSVGCPIVTTATTSMPEFIEDGVNGFITNDPKVMRERIELLINDKDLAKVIGDAGRQTVIEQFGQQQFLNKWNEIFRRVSKCPSGRLS